MFFWILSTVTPITWQDVADDGIGAFLVVCAMTLVGFWIYCNHKD